MAATMRHVPQTMQRSHVGQGQVVPKPDSMLLAQPTQKLQEEQAGRRDVAKRRSERPSDRNIPNGVDDITIGDGVGRYNSLREVEKKLDAVMTRKRLDMQDSVLNFAREYRTLRISISNIVENQPWQQTGIDPDAFDFNSGTEATYRVRIEGRLLPEEDEADLDGPEEEPHIGDGTQESGQANSKNLQLPASVPGRKLSHFFKSIRIEYDRSSDLQPDGFTEIEWRKPEQRTRFSDTSSEAEFDCLEFERKSDENINVTICLERDETPERYGLSQALADLLDMEEGDRAEIVMCIWEYIRAMNLQEDEDSRRIHCDERLKAVFNSDTINFSEVPSLIRQHLTPLPPIELPYTIRVDQAFHESSSPSRTTTPNGTSDSNAAPSQSNYTIYDIRVLLDNPIRAQTLAFLQSPSTLTTLKSIAALDDALALLIQAIAQSKARHAFFTSMAKDPAQFIKRWISSQRRDLEVILGEGVRGAGEDGTSEEFRRGGDRGIWGCEEARESVGVFLARQPW